MKISLVVPHWPLRPEMDKMLDECLKSIPADEKIVIVNDGIGMGKAINIGLRASTGDYIIVSNNDCRLDGGDIKELCMPNIVTYVNQGQLGSFYCMPRSVYEQIGGYDEQYEIGYFEDEDLRMRWQEAGIKIHRIESLNLHHPGGTTLDTLPNRIEFSGKNREKFEKKWGKHEQSIY